jgi:hypothetical protein
MTSEELDKAVLGIIGEAREPMTVLEIERQMVAKDFRADTYEIQRSIRRLVNSKRVSLTKRLDVAPAAG